MKSSFRLFQTQKNAFDVDWQKRNFIWTYADTLYVVWTQLRSHPAWRARAIGDSWAISFEFRGDRQPKGNLETDNNEW